MVQELSHMAECVKSLKRESISAAESNRLDNIFDYFQDVRSFLWMKGVVTQDPAPWHTFPPDVDLICHILSRGPTLIDLFPDTAKEFENRRKVNGETFLKFAEVGAIIPDIYVRDVSKWDLKGAGYGYIHKMFRKFDNGEIKITMKGEVVDLHLKYNFPNYKNHKKYSNMWRRFFARYPDQLEPVLKIIGHLEKSLSPVLIS